ncbi:MAG: hypothetical protein JNL11_18585 [Bdellovibrionaceae bacterium]|nr:hypothetical protein [Pseudobdellovibrionaceae bacterium]
MSQFSIYTSLKISFFASFVLLSACNLPGTQKRSDANGQGSFYADEVTGEFIAENFLEEISLPKERVYGMKVCLRDLQYSKPVIHHPFLIEETNIELKSDATGCINWNESVKFEYLTDPAFLKIDRKIRSKGVHTGSYAISFAVNPWDTENYHSTIDLSKKKVEPLISGEDVQQKLSGKSQKASFDLWVEDGRLFANDEKMGDAKNNALELKYEFNLAPFIKTKKTSGELSQYNLKYGLFNGRLEIIQRYYEGSSSKNIYEILAGQNFSAEKMEKGNLSFTKILKFNGVVSRGSLFVRLYLQPSKTVANLNPFVGVFPIGDFRSIRTNQFLKILPSKDFIKELEAQLPLNRAYVTSPNGNATQQAETISVSQNAKTDSAISVTNIDFDSPLKSVQHLNHKRISTYPANICFVNNLTQTPITFQKFKVYGFSQDESKRGELKKEVLTSNNMGCIYWTENIEFDIYSCQHYYRGYIVIENPDYNISIKRYYYVNPWDNFFGAKDANKIEDPSKLNTSCETENPKRSEIVLTDVSFKTHLSNSTKNQPSKSNGSINSLLELDLQKDLGITIHPMVKIPSDLHQDYAHPLDPLVDGAYLLRVMIVRNINLTPKIEIIAQKDIPVINTRSGTIYARFPFNLKDHRLFHARNTLFMQLIPIKHDKVKATDDNTLELKNPNEPIENLINKDVSILSPIYTEEIVLDGENFKTLRPFSGSEYLTHLQLNYSNKNENISFSDLVSEFKEKVRQQQQTKEKMARPDTYAKDLNLDYYTEANVDSLSIASWLKSNVNANSITADKNAGQQLCDFWFNHYWNGKFNMGEYWLKRVCANAADENIKTFFDFDRVYFINNVTRSEYTGPGPERGLNLGTSFSVSTSYSAAKSTAAGSAGKLGAGAPLGGKFVSVGAEAYVGIEWSYTTAHSDSNSIAISEGSNLMVTESRFKIQSNDYQYCISVKPNAKLFQPSSKGIITQIWHGDIDYTQFFKPNVTDDEKISLSNKGIFICRAKKTTTNLVFNEQYYWVTQPMSDNEVQDSHDERNKIFTIMIRGNQDYNRFKYMLSRKWKRPEGSGQNSNSQDYLSGLMQMQSYKISPPGVHVWREP